MKRFAFVVLISLVALVPAAIAQPRYCPATGHFYEVVHVALNWADARAAAQASTFSGVAGDLVTITSAAEQAWFEAFMVAESPFEHVHAGGIQDPGGAEPGGGWGWATGEEWGFTAWYSGEPNQYNGTNEDTMFIFAGVHAGGGKWADGPESQSRHYAIEYDPTVPVERSTWSGIKALYK